jgi:AcrR family transcriptional regulator
VSSYHHGNLRASLIESGVALARSDGPDGVVLREVARRSGVSHNAAYRHFADREALLAEVAVVGMGRLGEAMKAEMASVEDEDDQDDLTRSISLLRATGRAYVRFALAEPGLFTVAFAAPVLPDEGSPDPVSEAPAPSTHPYELLGQALDSLTAAGGLSPERREGAEVLCWSAVHGFAVLHLDGPLRDVPVADRDVALESLLDQVERGLV